MRATVVAVAWAAAGPAFAQACPDPVALTEQALRQYDEADLDAAKQSVSAGYQSLACQTTVVPTAVLLDLYRVDALIALTQDDPKGMVYATIRAIAAKHDGGRPPDDYGPDLQAQYDTWSARLKQDLVTVRVVDGGLAYVDGRTVDYAHPLPVVSGEHLVQVPVPGAAPSPDPTVRSEVRELAGDTAL
ncbi:MAG: hypothetical protein ABMB14_32815, partial [Myxococcota bacterium]